MNRPPRRRGVAGAAAIRAAVVAWPGVEEAPHRFGGVEFRLAGREIGHLHGDRLLDVPFPRAVHDEVIAAGLARPHHVLPQSGWVSLWLDGDDDIAAAVALLRRSFDLVSAQLARRKAQAEAVRRRPTNPLDRA